MQSRSPRAYYLSKQRKQQRTFKRNNQSFKRQNTVKQ